MAMQSSSEESDYDSDKSYTLLIFALQVISDSDDAFLDSSFGSEVNGDPWELEAHPSDLLEFYFVMDSSRYHVDLPIT